MEFTKSGTPYPCRSQVEGTGISAQVLTSKWGRWNSAGREAGSGDQRNVHRPFSDPSQGERSWREARAAAASGAGQEATRAASRWWLLTA